MTIQGIPFHPLLVHFAVVFMLLAGGVQVLAVVLPRFRTWVGWALPVGASVAAIATALTASAGESLLARENSALARAHAEWGERAEVAGFLLAAVAVAYWLATSGAGRRLVGDRLPTWTAAVLGAAGVATGVLSIALVTVAGHSGASAVWAG